MRGLIFGCGYVGQRVAATWLRAGHEVAAVTRSRQNADAFQQQGIRPLIGDICEAESLADLPEADVILYAVGFDRTSPRSHEEVTCAGCKTCCTRRASVVGDSFLCRAPVFMVNRMENGSTRIPPAIQFNRVASSI